MGFSLSSWLSRTLSRTDAPRSAGQKPKRDERYHAVGIRPGDNCCEAARQFGKLRFLSAQAPQLPLPGCQQSSCTCRYSHYPDRRHTMDQRSELRAGHQTGSDAIDHRLSKGRRTTDSV
jgi:hypothetical protein